MDIRQQLIKYETEIFNLFKEIKFDVKFSNYSTPDSYKNYSLDKSQDINFYQVNFDMYIFKNPPNKKSLFNCAKLNYNIKNNITKITNPDVLNIFQNSDIFNIFYFEIYGDVVEHIDPNGYDLGYNQLKYNSLMMAVNVPKSDKFKTYYDGKEIKMEQGKFVDWNVREVKHHWIYPPLFDDWKQNERLKLLHIDYR
jgi:hypothetical protein